MGIFKKLKEKLSGIIGSNFSWEGLVGGKRQAPEKREGIKYGNRVEPIPFKELERVYKSCGLVNAIIEKYVNRLAGGQWILEHEDPQIIEKFTSKFFVNDGKEPNYINIKRKGEDIIRDFFIGGNVYILRVLNQGKTDMVDLVFLDPDRVDFIRDEQQDIMLNTSTGLPVGFEFSPNYGTKVELPYEAIAHMKLFTIGGSWLGWSPTASGYKTIICMMNVEDAIAEVAFRGAAPLLVGKLGDPEHRPTPDGITKLDQDLRTLKETSTCAFPYFVTIERIQTPDLSSMQENLEYLVEQVKEIFLLPSSKKGGRAGAISAAAWEKSVVDFERDIQSMRERFAEQIEQLIFKPYAELAGLSGYPKLKMYEESPTMRLGRARRLSTLAKTGLITPTVELENVLREEERLPLIKEIPKEEKPPEKSKDEKEDTSTKSESEGVG